MSERQVLGCVTEKERDEMRTIYSRRAGLNEMLTVLAGGNISVNSEMYDRLIKDFSASVEAFGGWYNRVSAKYGWPNDPMYIWDLDFTTRLVSLSPRQ